MRYMSDMSRQILWLWLRSTPWHKSQLILLQHSNQHEEMVISHTHNQAVPDEFEKNIWTKIMTLFTPTWYSLYLVYSDLTKSFLVCTATVHAYTGQFYPQTFILTKLSHLLKNKRNILHCAAILQCAPVEESRDNGVKQVHPSTPLSPSHLALSLFPVVQEAWLNPPHPLVAG